MSPSTVDRWKICTSKVQSKEAKQNFINKSSHREIRKSENHNPPPSAIEVSFAAWRTHSWLSGKPKMDGGGDGPVSSV